MVEVMGGAQSEKFEYFKTLIGKGFLALRRNYLLVLSAVELMLKAGMFCSKLCGD
jgi:phosphatidylinositol kinase/protein kinase (PI-3  family)